MFPLVHIYLTYISFNDSQKCSIGLTLKNSFKSSEMCQKNVQNPKNVRGAKNVRHSAEHVRHGEKIVSHGAKNMRHCAEN